MRSRARGVLGEYGYYEAIDYTKARVPPGREGVVVKAYFAHHQGMSLVALDNALHEAPMQRRFHSDARMQATELLLEERVPQAVPGARDRVLRSPRAGDHRGRAVGGRARRPLAARRAARASARPWRTRHARHRARHRLHHLAQARHPPLPRGCAARAVRHLHLPAQPDPGRAIWSAAFEPTRVQPLHYDAAFAPHRVDFQRRDGEIETLLHVTVSPEHAADVRRLTLVNHGSESCEIEITSYTEIVLAPRAADRAHRAFSGMFVQTEALESGAGLIATRRQREQGEFQPWLIQVLAAEQGVFGELAHETSREAFLGRGRSVHAPRALDAGGRLSSHTGAVLDPAFALRRTVRLAPGAAR